MAPVLSASTSSPNGVGVGENPLRSAAVRAKSEIGAAVYSTDGQTLGTVSDYVLQFDALPQLRYVIVRTGGSLGHRAAQRAVPADAIASTNGRLQARLTGADYAALPILPSNHRAFLSANENLAQLAKLSGTPLEHAALKSDFVLFSDLSELFTVVDQRGAELGTFTDLWIDFNANEAPYLEYDPINGELDLSGNTAYDVPTVALTRVQTGEIHFALGEADLEHLKWIDEASAYVAAAGDKLEATQNKSER